MSKYVTQRRLNVCKDKWTNYFKVKTSAIQGYPISPLLYILQIEPLACTLRKDIEVTGKELLNNSGVNVSMFQEDTKLFLKDKISIINSMKFLSTFKEASGSKNQYTENNWDLYRGIKTRSSYHYLVKTCVKILVIYHGNIVDNDAIWKENFDKIKSCLHIWKTRSLSLKGKSLNYFKNRF